MDGLIPGAISPAQSKAFWIVPFPVITGFVLRQPADMVIYPPCN